MPMMQHPGQAMNPAHMMSTAFKFNGPAAGNAGSPGLAGSPPNSGLGDAGAGAGASNGLPQLSQQQSQFVQMALPPGLDREKLAALSQVCVSG